MLNVKGLILHQLLLIWTMLQRAYGNILKRLAHHVGILTLFSNQVSIATVSLDTIQTTHIWIAVCKTLKLTGGYDGIMQVLTARMFKSLFFEVDVVYVGSICVPIEWNCRTL